jgi:hypothetical protein
MQSHAQRQFCTGISSLWFYASLHEGWWDAERLQLDTESENMKGDVILYVPNI